MRNFRKFDGDARRFLMAVLFAMPLCSAADLARLNTYSRAYVGKMLPVLEAEGLVFREKAGHAHGRVWRWALTGAGVAFVSSECDVTPGWPHSNEGLHYLRLRMDLVETTYRVVPGLFQDFAETIRFQGTFFLVAQGYWDMDEPVPVLVSEEYRLAGFQWGLAPQFDAVAEYEVSEPMSKLDATTDKTPRVQIPVVRWGVHGKPPMEPDTVFADFPEEPCDAETMGFQGIRYAPWYAGQPYLPRLRFLMRPAAVITITPQNDFAELHFRVGSGEPPPYKVIPFDDAGASSANVQVEGGHGAILEPVDRGPVTVPNITTGAPGRSGRSDAARPRRDDPILAAVNGAMASRVFGVVSSHRAIAYADIVKVCGKTDRASVRGNLAILVDAKLVASHNDIFFLAEAGWQLCAIREGVNVEVVSAKFNGMFNQDGMVSRRWVRRNAMIARFLISLQAEGIPAVAGWHPSPRQMRYLHMGPDEEVPNPDLWVFPNHTEWTALEYLEATPQHGTTEQRLIQYSGDKSRRFAGLLAVCETAAVERTVALAGSKLTMLTTTRAEVLRGPHRGADSIWRYRGHPNDVEALWRRRLESPPAPVAETGSAGNPESAPSPVSPKRRRWFSGLRLPGT